MDSTKDKGQTSKVIGERVSGKKGIKKTSKNANHSGRTIYYNSEVYTNSNGIEVSHCFQCDKNGKPI